jgi:hypothetical protein
MINIEEKIPVLNVLISFWTKPFALQGRYAEEVAI